MAWAAGAVEGDREQLPAIVKGVGLGVSRALAAEADEVTRRRFSDLSYGNGSLVRRGGSDERDVRFAVFQPVVDDQTDGDGAWSVRYDAAC